MRNTKSKKTRRRQQVNWEELYMKKLLPIHKNHSKKIFHRMMKKSSTLKSSLKRRSKEYEVEFDISLEEVRELLYVVYGRTCNYCNQKLVVNNMACDHIHPLSLGGDSTVPNLQMICMRCNTRKGPLTHRQFNKLLKWLKNQEQDVSRYILRKLSSRDF